MPHSTGSIDSGFYGFANKRELNKELDDTNISKSLPMTDEDELASSICGASSTSSILSSEFSTNSSSTPNSSKVSVFTNPGRRNRAKAARDRRNRLYRANHSKQRDSSILLNMNVDELATQIYMYFTSMLDAVNRHKAICESIGNIVHDADARWGHVPTRGRRRNHIDPKGCLAPIYMNLSNTSGSKVENCSNEGTLVTPAGFPSYWAIPQPSVYYALMAGVIKEYLTFLERSIPNVKNETFHPDVQHSPEEVSIMMQQYLQKKSLECGISGATQNQIHPICKIPDIGRLKVASKNVGKSNSYEEHGTDEMDGEKMTLEIKPLMEGIVRKSKVAAKELSEKRNNCVSELEELNGVTKRNSTVRQNETEETQLRPKSISSISRCESTSSNRHCVASSMEDVTMASKNGVKNGILPPSPPKDVYSSSGQFQVSHMDVLSEKIWHYHNKVAQTDSMLSRKLHLRDMLYAAISPVFPMCGLYVVGSSLNGFGNNSSDMDLCLMITNKELDQKNDAVVVLNLILTTLQYEKFVTSQKLILAKVPILRIRFAEPFTDIMVDLNANNSVAIKNTHLLCYYSSYDWRVRPLVSVVKEWAKKKGINDANKSSFTSYSLVLMVIHYLQCGTKPAVLPNLQKLFPDRFSNKCDVRTLNVTMPLENPVEPFDNCENHATLGELLIGFLQYYAFDFDYNSDAISIREGQRLDRSEVTRPKPNTGHDISPPSSSASTSSLQNGNGNMQHWRAQWRCVCIVEPFTNLNTAHSIYDEMVFDAIKAAFREAHSELMEFHDLDRLLDCAPINVPIQCTGATVFAASYEGERPSSSQIPMMHSNTMMRPVIPFFPPPQSQNVVPIKPTRQFYSQPGQSMQNRGGNRKNHAPRASRSNDEQNVHNNKSPKNAKNSSSKEVLNGMTGAREKKKEQLKCSENEKKVSPSISVESTKSVVSTESSQGYAPRFS